MPDKQVVGCGDSRIKKEAERAAGLILMSEGNQSKNNDEDNRSQEIKETIEGIVHGLPCLEKKQTKQFFKEGDYSTAQKDFHKLDLISVRPNPDKKGEIGTLSDGLRANVREESTAQVPTLEVYNPTNGTSIKIRYITKEAYEYTK